MKDKLKPNKGTQGYSIVHFLIFLGLTSFCTAIILKTQLHLFKQLKKDLTQEQLDITGSHCLSSIISFTKNSVTLNGLNFFYWHDSFSKLNNRTRELIINKNAVARINNNSAILETSQISLPIYYRQTPKSRNLEYFSSNLVTLSNTPETYNSFLLLNPWSSLVINSKARINKIIPSQRRLTLTQKPQFISSIGDQNFMLSELELAYEDSMWIAPLNSYGIVYHAKNDTLEYLSLATSDRQPLCENLSGFIKEGNKCKLESKSINLNSTVEINCKNSFDSPINKLEALEKWR